MVIAATALPTNLTEDSNDHIPHSNILHTAVNSLTADSQGGRMNLRSQPGVVGDGTADDSAAINSAAASAVTLGVRLYGSGTFRINSTVTLLCDADLSESTFNYYGSGIAVQVGSSTVLRRKTINLPNVIASNKTGVGWSQVSGTVGVKILNVASCFITSPWIRNFVTGLLVRGEGQGCTYNDIRVLHLDTNSIQHDISADSTGWSNQNNYYIQRFSYSSSEGSNLSGTRNIRIQTATNIPNNNVWWGGSLEGDTPEYHMECAGYDNRFIHMRWENSGGCRVYWRNGTTRNEIDGGYGVHQIIETFETGALPQYVHSAAQSRFGNFVSSAVSTINYVTQIDSTGVRVKPQTGTVDRIVLGSDGRCYLGAGTVAPTAYLIGVSTSGIGLYAGNFYSGTDNTYDIGLISSLRFRYIRAATAVVTGAFATGSRPSASTAGAGAMVFDTTLNKPIWSTGSAWVDATGTTV